MWKDTLSKFFDGEALQSGHLPVVVVNLVLAILLSQILTWHYLRYAQVLSNKSKFARVFVFIATTTFLLITVVKTSLALSLGLVGALSIIRFRTPIKEPEELAYLFLAIAVGVGLGASGGETDPWWPTFATVVVFVAILLFLSLRSGLGRGEPPQRTVLQIAAPLADDAGAEAGSQQLQLLMPAVEAYCSKVDLRRVDCGAGEFQASLLVEIADSTQVAELLAGVRASLPGASVSLIEWEGLE